MPQPVQRIVFARFSGHAILRAAMKLLLGLFALFLVALSVLADYKWKQWIAARKQNRDR
jgi:hypothetical protein